MPLFTTPVTPWYLSDPGAMVAEYNGAAVLVANSTYLIGVFLPGNAVATNMRIRHAAVSAGNLDMGIYDASGNLLDHTGSTACSAVNTVQTLAFSNGNLALSQGRYYLALWVDNSTDTYYRFGAPSANTSFQNILIGTTPASGGLKSNFAAMGGTSATTQYVALMATLSGTGF